MLESPSKVDSNTMGAGTKKVGTAGRFGVRYGLRLRQKLIEIEQRQKIKHECPFCHKLQLKRASKGIWSCHKCDKTFAGKAYWPKGE